MLGTAVEAPACAASAGTASAPERPAARTAVRQRNNAIFFTACGSPWDRPRPRPAPGESAEWPVCGNAARIRAQRPFSALSRALTTLIWRDRGGLDDSGFSAHHIFG